MEIGKGRLALDKLQVHQPTARVVDKHQQRALRPAILKPPVLATVNLDQLADTIATVTGLVNTLSPPLAVEPQPGFDHPQPQRLSAECDFVNLTQFLGCQGRAKIPVPLANDCENRSAQRFGFPSIAAATASLRDQARRTLSPVRLQQPEHLTALEPQQLPRRLRRQPFLIQIPQHFEPRQLPIAHQPYRHP